jgi:3-dehydroquinate dehydratase
VLSKYCLPIVKSNLDHVQSEIEGHSGYPKFEIWLDYLEAVQPGPVRALADRYPGRLVFHFRRRQLEPIRTPLATRLEVIQTLSGAGVMLDLDAASQLSEFDHIRSGQLGLQVIASYHNYESTPSDRELRDTVQGLRDHQPDVVKVAAFCREDADALRLLQLQLELKTQGVKHIILGMGPHGLPTRVFGTLWGNELAFVPESSAEASAPGQLTKSQLDTIFANLGA